MAVLALKLLLTPLLIAAASMVQRARGGLAGGLIAGLPLTSAPISFFLALEHGPAFAVAAAVGTLFGVVAMSGFCVVYTACARRLGWMNSLVCASTACIGVTVGVSFLPQRLDVATAVAFPALVGMVAMIGEPASSPGSVEPAWWDTPARMVVAALAVVCITAAAALLGPTWSGLLATLPVLAAVMGVFSHRHAGPDAAHVVLRGIAVGALGAATFFAAVAMLVKRMDLAVAYALAVSAALTGATLTHYAFKRRTSAAGGAGREGSMTLSAERRTG